MQDEPINATDAAFMIGEAVYQRDGVSPLLREVMHLKRDNDAKPATPVPDMVEAVARAMAPSVFLPFNSKIHGSPVNRKNAQAMWMKKAQAALTACRAQVEGEIVAWLRNGGHLRRGRHNTLAGVMENAADAITRHEHRSADNG